jgi:hypothetical protein
VGQYNDFFNSKKSVGVGFNLDAQKQTKALPGFTPQPA